MRDSVLLCLRCSVRARNGVVQETRVGTGTHGSEALCHTLKHVRGALGRRCSTFLRRLARQCPARTTSTVLAGSCRCRRAKT